MVGPWLLGFLSKISRRYRFLPWAVFNQQWLPSLPLLIDQLPTYEVGVHRGENGAFIIHEQGLPLATFLGGLGATVSWFEVADRYARVRERKTRQATEGAGQDQGKKPK